MQFAEVSTLNPFEKHQIELNFVLIILRINSIFSNIKLKPDHYIIIYIVNKQI